MTVRPKVVRGALYARVSGDRQVQEATINPKFAVIFGRYFYAIKALQRFLPSICSQEYFSFLLGTLRRLSTIPE